MRCFHTGLCFLMLTVCCAFAEPVNLLKSADFKPDAGKDLPSDWRISADSKVVVDTADKPEGAEQSLKATVNKESASYGEITQRLSVQANKNYLLAGNVKSSRPGLAFFQIKLYQGKKELSRITSKKSGTQWAAIEQQFNSKNANIIEVLCRYSRTAADQGENAWFAKMSLVEMQEEKSAAIPAQPAVDSSAKNTPDVAPPAAAVATFNSIGLTVPADITDASAAACTVRYRVKGAAEWRYAQSPVYVVKAKSFRGSILNLQPAADYEIECRITGADKTERVSSFAATTWSHDVPIARVVRLPSGVSGQPLIINDQGAPDAWVLYTSAEDTASTLNAEKKARNAIRFENAAYVIVENLTVRGGEADAVFVSKSHHIRIRHCDIAGWGDPGTPKDGLKFGRYVDADGKLINYQAGVHVGPGSSQVVVEGNYIHHPRGTANSWQYGHPAGPQGVILDSSNGNHVVINNDIIGNEQHWWNDAIESMHNSNVNGGPYHDTDIQGNVLAFANDDATELDGGQINIRFFNNWSQWTYCGVSCAPNLGGPSYVFRNLMILTGEERGRTNFAFKMGGDMFSNPGRTFLWHNTAISNGYGISTGHYGKGGTPITSRNNVIVCATTRLTGKIQDNYDLDHDLLPAPLEDPALASQEKHAIFGMPQFVNAKNGDYRLAAGSLGSDAAVLMANVNDGFSGGAPEAGAFENPSATADFPMRAGDMSALPLFVHLPGQPGDIAKVRLNIPKALGATWTAYPNASWLACKPASGNVTGSEQTLELSVASSSLELRKYRGAVTFRTNTGYCRTILLESLIRHPHPFMVSFEAESAALKGSFDVVKEQSASGGSYIHNATGPMAATPEASPARVSFEMDIPEDGTYYIFGRAMAPGPNSDQKDSFYMIVDDAPAKRWDLMYSGSSQWHWMPIVDAKAAGGGMNLTKGRHVLHILARERLARLDAVCISNEPYVPE